MALTTLEPFGAEGGYDHVVVEIRRVSRTVKGGRRFRFRAIVVVGDKKGRIGLGLKKGKDVQAAVTKAQGAAGKHLIVISLHGGTIPHMVRSSYGGSEVLLKPAPAGTGIMAGSAVRAIAVLAGIRDLSSKLQGSRNKLNATKAMLKALQSLKPVPKKPASPGAALDAEQVPHQALPADAGQTVGQKG